MHVPTALLDRYFDGTLSAPEFDELVAWINADDAHAAEFTRHAALHTHLHTYLQSSAELTDEVSADEVSADEVSADEVSADETPTSIGRRAQRAWAVLSWPPSVSLISAALVLGLLLTAMALVAPPFYQELTRNDDESTQPRQFVAQLIRSLDAKWQDESQPVLDGAHLRQGRTVQLTAGLAEIRFASGARVILEGPAKFRLESRNAGTLDTGRLVARVEGPQAKGFTINTPTAQIVDLGTEFGVSVLDSGALRVSVFAGAIEYRSRGHGVQTLTEGEAVRIRDERLEKIEPPRFVRSLPRRKSLSVNLYCAEQPTGRINDRGPAGVFPSAHWNNFELANTGQPRTLERLMDDQGEPTATRIVVDADNSWQVDLGPINTHTKVLENGYWDTGPDNGRITITNLPNSFTAAGYLVLVYLHGTDAMGDNTAAEFGAKIGAEEYWLRWLKNAPDGTFRRSMLASEADAQASQRDDNLLIFDNGGAYYTSDRLTIDVLRDPDSAGAKWGRAAVSAIQLVERTTSPEDHNNQE